MKTLILMRHAKSSWAEPGMDDHDRPLSARGRSAAPVMAHWLQTRGLRPDRVLCSPSRRTCETLELMRDALPLVPDPDLPAALYHAGPGALLKHLKRLPRGCASVLVIGHEPGLGALLRMLGGGAAAPECRRACDHFPTAAVAVLEADIGDWRDLGADRVEFVDFAVPRELMQYRAPGA
ncbi:MAG: histidine phosphatase family protein [Paracoccaceae bacterium]